MTSVGRARTQLVAHALSLPGAWEAHPWNETVAKVGKKIFVFFGQDSPDLLVGVKLGRSLHYARTLKAANRFGYGMDDAGWVALRYVKGEGVPVAELLEWIDESYELVAPKKRVSRRARA